MSATPLPETAVASPLPFVVREGRVGDVGFVTASWRESFYVGSPAAQYADREHYNHEMTRVFSQLLHGAAIIVVCDAEDDDTLLGFAVHTKGELHYVYVRQDFRKMGIARVMLERIMPRSYTFRTLAGERRLRPRERGWRFTPRFTL